MRSLSAGRTAVGWLRAREIVAVETPAALATWLIVIVLAGFLMGKNVTKAVVGQAAIRETTNEIFMHRFNL